MSSGPTGMAIQGDGKIVMAFESQVKTYTGKTSYVTTPAYAVARFNPNGTLDTTFGSAGIAMATTPYNTNPMLSQTYALALQADGKIVVSGYVYNPLSNGGGAFGLVRFNSNGTLDTTFGSGGEVTTLRDSFGAAYGEQIAIDSAGRIIVAGFRICGTGGAVGTYGVGVIRYNPDGSPDTTFGTGGVSIIDTSMAHAVGIGFQSDGKIVVMGEGLNHPGAKSPLIMARYNPDGSQDSTFGTGGHYEDDRIMAMQHQPFSTWGWGNNLVVEPGTDALVADGRGFDGTNVLQMFRVTRVLADGSSYDPTFGTTGLSDVQFSNPYAVLPSSLALSPDGKIAVTGRYESSSTAPYSLATARLIAEAPTTTTLASSAPSSIYGDPVTFTATVTTAGALAPTGTVEFWDGTTELGTAALTTVNGVTTAVFTIATLSPGTHNLRAIYDGDTNDLSSTSADLSQVVN